jgi:hypothetical protein
MMMHTLDITVYGKGPVTITNTKLTKICLKRVVQVCQTHSS